MQGYAPSAPGPVQSLRRQRRVVLCQVFVPHELVCFVVMTLSCLLAPQPRVVEPPVDSASLERLVRQCLARLVREAQLCAVASSVECRSQVKAFTCVVLLCC